MSPGLGPPGRSLKVRNLTGKRAAPHKKLRREVPSEHQVPTSLAGWVLAKTLFVTTVGVGANGWAPLKAPQRSIGIVGDTILVDRDFGGQAIGGQGIDLYRLAVAVDRQGGGSQDGAPRFVFEGNEDGIAGLDVDHLGELIPRSVFAADAEVGFVDVDVDGGGAGGREDAPFGDVGVPTVDADGTVAEAGWGFAGGEVVDLAIASDDVAGGE